MNPHRRSTVHDLAALRLHRDNSRVLNSDSNTSSRRAKYALRDARGNWIAQDAGGLGKVKQRRSASHPDEHEDATEPEADEDMEDHEPSPTQNKGKNRVRESGSDDDTTLNARAQRRRRFDEDMGYLESMSQSSAVLPNDGHNPLQAVEGLPGTLPTPSSDLLKCLHHFASSYYTAMGQLYDATREARQERKMRRLAKRKENESASSSRVASSEATKVNADGEGSGEETTESSGEDDNADDAEAPKEDQKGSRQRRKPRGGNHSVGKDMYKIFEGSALVALGMLLQEHVMQSLESHVPEGWEKEMSMIERNRHKEERRIRQAKRMREVRHPVKAEQAEKGQLESEDEGEDRTGEGADEMAEQTDEEAV